MISQEDLALSSAALAKSESDLYFEIGGFLIGPDGPTRGDEDNDDFRDRGKNWFERNRGRMKGRLCGDAVLMSRAGDSVLATATIADYISEHILGKPAAFLVAAVVFQQGLSALCEN